MIPELRRRLALESIEQFEFFRSVQWLDQVDSTNRHLDRQIKAGQVPLPCIAVADELVIKLNVDPPEPQWPARFKPVGIVT